MGEIVTPRQENKDAFVSSLEDLAPIEGRGTPVELAGQRPTRRSGWGRALLLFAPIPFLPLLSQESLPFAVQLAALAICGVSLWPLYRWLAQGCRGFPGFEFVMVAYGLNFGAAVFLQWNEIVIFSKLLLIPPEWLNDATLLSLLGVVSTIAGHRLGQWLCRATSLKPWRRELKTGGIGSLAVGLIVVSIVGVGLTALGGESLGGLGRLVGNQLYVGLALLAYADYQRRGTPGVVLWVAVLVATALGMASGMMEAAMMPLVVIILIHWEMIKRPPVVMLVCAAVAFVLLQQIKYQYRVDVWLGGEAGTISEKFEKWRKLATEEARDQTAGRSEPEAWRSAMKRFDLIHRFAYVRGMTPDTVPFFKGETYSYFLYTFIPRAFWADKPKANATEVIDYAYRFSSPDVERNGTNIGIGILPEAYANFGGAGVGLVMLLQGIAFGCLGWLLNTQSLIARAIYVSVVIWFFNGIGTSAVMFFGSIIQLIIASILIVRPFLGKALRPTVPVTG